MDEPSATLLRDVVQDGARGLFDREKVARAAGWLESRTDLPAELIGAAAALRRASGSADVAMTGARVLRLLDALETKRTSTPGTSAANEAQTGRKARPSRRERDDARAKASQRKAQERANAPGADARDRPVETLQGIGPALGVALRRRGLETLEDLSMLLPRRYDDETQVTPIGALEPGARQVTVGVVASSRWAGRRVFEVRLEPLPTHPTGRHAQLRLVWFRAPQGQAARFVRGARFRVSGAIEDYRGVLTMAHPDTDKLDDQSDGTERRGYVPRYPEVPGVPPRTLARVVRAAVTTLAPHLQDVAPPEILKRESLPTLTEALRALHMPPDTLSAEELQALREGRTPAHARLAFEEFVLLEAALHERRRDEASVEAAPLPFRQDVRDRVKASLRFALTSAQARVVDEIAHDLARERPMRRLLQGDVGSGKTAVAMLSAAHAAGAGAQAVLMAPTEILAAQHLRSLTPVANALGLRISLVLGGERASHRKKTRAGLENGTIDLAIGTHALLTEGVQFHKLGLVIVDEQHRFGVAQRLRLVQKSAASGHEVAPHLLVMTATPIPRTLALTLYGDLDVSTLDEMPPGRTPPVTKAYGSDQRERVLDVMRRAIAKDGQVYVVCPAIEPSEEDPDLRSTAVVFEELRAAFGSESVALLHGRQDDDARRAAMDAFVAGTVRILVTTTVIEVGVDVPRANLIVIEQAERFGLAQLHQLRGRVGRAGQPSACLLVHEARSEEAVARIRTLCETHDGFRVAEEDLRLRGPGELFGRRQSGLPGFRFGDLSRDLEWLAKAREVVRGIVDSDPGFAAPEHRGLRGALDRMQRSTRALVKEEAG